MSLDLAPAIRTALLAEPTITGLLSEYKGAPAVQTRRPVPDGVVFPYVVVGEDVSITDADGLTSDRPIVIRDVLVYGAQPDDYRAVEQIGYAIRELFHREQFSLILTDYDVIEITATGPRAAPTSNTETVGRVVTLTIQLRSKI